jgi:hypothetical protein
MKKIIYLKESQLRTLIESVVKLNEQPGQVFNFARKYFASAMDGLTKKYGDDGAKKIETVLNRGFGSKTNYIFRNGEVFLLSKSGTEVPYKTINMALNAIASGKYNVDEILVNLPRQLADGTEFRSVFTVAKPKPQGAIAPSVTSSIHKFKPGTNFSSEYLKQHGDKVDVSKIKNWDYYGGTLDGYLKGIANAIKTNEYKYISSGGFEKFGISNFRDFLKSSRNLEKVSHADPTRGFFSFIVK